MSLGINDRNTSLIHHLHLVFQKRPYGIYGIQDDAHPRSTSFRERYDPPSGSFRMHPIGHWFMRLAISYRHLWNSNCINTCSPIAFFFLGLIDSLQDLITCLDATKQCITGEQANKRHTYCGDQLNWNIFWLFSWKQAKHLLFKDANKIFFLFHQALILSDLSLHFLNLHFLRLKSMP